MIYAVIDTSSLVSLEMIKALEQSHKVVKLVIPKAVEAEIKEMKKYKDSEGKAAKNIVKKIKKGLIKTVKIKNSEKARSLLSKEVHLGEAECLACCLQEKINTLIMDDVNAGYKLEGIAIANKIKIKHSIAVLVELFREKQLSKAELNDCIKKLIKTRKWEGGALEVLCKKHLQTP